MTAKKRFKETEATYGFTCHKCDGAVAIGDICCWDQQYRTTANKSYRWCKSCADQEPQMFEPSNATTMTSGVDWSPIFERIAAALENKQAANDPEEPSFDEILASLQSKQAELFDAIHNIQSTLSQCVDKIVALEEKKSIFNKDRT